MSAASWVTFDCYGTLVDWEGGIADALAPLLPKPIPRAELAARYIATEAQIEGGEYRPYREVLAAAGARLLGELGVKPTPAQERLLPDSLPNWPPFPETADVLRRLKAMGLRIAILSNVDRDLLAASIERIGVAPDLAVTAEDARSYKPAPGHWERFQESSGAGPQETVHVGASIYHDMIPGAALGYRTIFINRNGEDVRGATPDAVLPDLAGLATAVGELR